MTARTCLDCPTPISVKSKGRCRRCANAILNRSPEKRARSAIAMKRRFADPLYKQAHLERAQAGIDRAMQDPALVEMKRRVGRDYGAANIVTTQRPESRAKAGRRISAAKVAHIPAGYRELYRSLKQQNLTAAERERLVLEQKAHDEATAAEEVARSVRAMEARHRRQLENAY